MDLSDNNRDRVLGEVELLPRLLVGLDKVRELVEEPQPRTRVQHLRTERAKIRISY